MLLVHLFSTFSSLRITYSIQQKLPCVIFTKLLIVTSPNFSSHLILVLYLTPLIIMSLFWDGQLFWHLWNCPRLAPILLKWLLSNCFELASQLCPYPSWYWCSAELGVPNSLLLMFTCISQFGIFHKQYADDTQLHIALSTGSINSSIMKVEHCLHFWFCQNGSHQ